MKENNRYEAKTLSQQAILKQLAWFRDMSEFYRRALDYGDCDENEINAFETEKNTFLWSHSLEDSY
jgi:hypothetical protein